MDEQQRQEMNAGQENRDRGDRAENVANWYFRLNGFLSIPGFIVHLDRRYVPDGSQRYARTEADFMGVRFPDSREKIDKRFMVDDNSLTQLAATGKDSQTLFVLVEVKAGECKMNGPWTNPQAENMQRVIRRLGFVQDEHVVENIASAMYDHARWEDDCYVLQYICVGGRKDPVLGQRFQGLVQIDWRDIAHFLFHRFHEFPEKYPGGYVHEQWPDFGRQYAKWFTQNRNASSQESVAAVERYIQTARCKPAAT